MPNTPNHLAAQPPAASELSPGKKAPVILAQPESPYFASDLAASPSTGETH